MAVPISENLFSLLSPCLHVQSISNFYEAALPLFDGHIHLFFYYFIHSFSHFSIPLTLELRKSADNFPRQQSLASFLFLS
jgi:hypothetical protein